MDMCIYTKKHYVCWILNKVKQYIRPLPAKMQVKYTFPRKQLVMVLINVAPIKLFNRRSSR